MQTHKILTIILIILAIFLSISVLLQNKKPEPVTENTSTTTSIVATSTILNISSTTSPATTTKPIVQTFPKNITLSISDSYTFPDGTVLTIKQINDSRCPIDVQCVWAGNVVVKFNINKGNTDEDFELKYSINNNEPSVYKYKEYKIKILNIQPDRGVENNITESKNYRITINISK